MSLKPYLSDVRRIICHANCPDGLASAMILAHALPQASVEFVSYGAELEALIPTPGCIFCDISPARSNAAAFVKAGAIVLDHHKTARDVVAMFGDRGVFADETTEPGVSGALLACTEVLRHIEADDYRYWLVHGFATLAGVRDTWQTSDPAWDTACAQAEALMFFGPEHFLLELRRGRAVPVVTDEETRVGRHVMHQRRAAATRVCENPYLLGKVAVFNDTAHGGMRLISDVGEALRDYASPLLQAVAGFLYTTDPDGSLRLVVSLRSVDEAVDVAAIAKANGGGGHTKAAGFSTDGNGVPVLDAIAMAFCRAGRKDLVT